MPNVEIRRFPRPGHEELFVTAKATDVTGADRVFSEVAASLARNGAAPFREKVYGSLAQREALLAARARCYAAAGLEVDTPVGFIDGTPLGAGGFAGVQVHAVRGGADHVIATVDRGRLWRGPGFRLLHLTDIAGVAGGCITDQAAHMFRAADEAARANGFSFARTARTWIYLARLLDWYGEFNRVRSDAYRHHDFVPPASTGIQGRSGETECTMDALLVDGLEFRPIDRTVRQGSACSYGSRFSRGVTIARDGGAITYVSGTASIDPDGRSLHPDDPTAQFAETLVCVGAVLAESGMRLGDICEATLFCKDERTLDACNQLRDLLGIAAFPTIEVLADVCRPELLVEMEAVACR